MSYLYVANNDTANRFDQITIQADNGSLLLLRMGRAYNLSEGELARARRFVVLTDSSQPPEPVDSGGGSGSGNLIVTNVGDAIPSPVGQAVGTLWVRVRE